MTKEQFLLESTIYYYTEHVKNNRNYLSKYRKTRFMDAATWEKSQWRNQQIDKILEDE